MLESIKEIAEYLFGKDAYSIVRTCALGEPNKIWRAINNTTNAQVFYRDEEVKKATFFLKSDIYYLHDKEIHVSLDQYTGDGWIRATLNPEEFAPKIMSIADRIRSTNFMIACDEVERLFAMYHVEHWDYFTKDYSAVNHVLLNGRQCSQ